MTKDFDRIEKTSPIYLRRLAKELRRQVLGSGVYYNHQRVLNARVISGVLHVLTFHSTTWFQCEPDECYDALGSAIVVSTTVCGR